MLVPLCTINVSQQQTTAGVISRCVLQSPNKTDCLICIKQEWSIHNQHLQPFIFFPFGNDANNQQDRQYMYNETIVAVET
jgi:hypothetical protein